VAFTLVYSNGFETGSTDCIPTADRDVSSGVSTTIAKTGSYSFVVQNHANDFLRIPISGTEFYVGFWHNIKSQFGNDGKGNLEFVLTDGVLIGLRRNTATNCYDYYLNGVLTTAGTVVMIPGQWFHVQMHVKIADSPDGIFESRIDGIPDITETGVDTKPTAATDIAYFRILTVATEKNTYTDDLVIGTGDWAGDIRIVPILPTGDDTVGDWTRSAAGSDYALVDEVPPNTTDYIYTGLTGKKSYVSLANPTLTGMTPQWCKLYCRAIKDGSGGTQQLKLVDKEGASINTGAAQDINTAYGYITKTLLTSPDGTAWDSAHVDALIVGVESNIA
jgi:hypothetical protein